MHTTGKLTPTEVVAYFLADPMPCLVCGRKFQLLGRHVRRHGMTVKEYCEKYGIPFLWKGHTGLATMAQRKQKSDQVPQYHREEMRHLHKLSSKPPRASKATRRVAYYVVQHGLSGLADRKCRQCDKIYTPSSNVNKGWCSRQCASKRAGMERPWQVTAPSPCVNCGKIYKPLRRGRCNACRIHFSTHGTEKHHG